MIEVPDAIGLQPHQPRAGEVRSDWIIRENDFAEVAVRAVKRAVAFHRDNAISNNEVNWHRCTDIQDAAIGLRTSL